MPLGRSVVNDQVLPFDPAVIAQAVLPHFEDWRVLESGIKIADPPRWSFCPQGPWRNEQRGSSRYKIPPFHSILIAA
jgi:hypothetical protein